MAQDHFEHVVCNGDPGEGSDKVLEATGKAAKVGKLTERGEVLLKQDGTIANTIQLSQYLPSVPVPTWTAEWPGLD